MRAAHRAALAALAVSAALVTAIPAQAAPAGSGAGSAASAKKLKGATFAVIGDVPYGAAQIAAFPTMIDQLNADPDVSLVLHLGDIKNGSSVCSDDYFSLIRSDVDRFVDPLVYTIGDNEWTDCHRANNGSYNPLERLAAVRKVFFDRPGQSLGRHPENLSTDAAAGFPEDVRLVRQSVQFASLHVVGSDNSLLPWTGNTTATPEQAAEESARTADVLSLISRTFDHARREHSKAVVLALQADMFDPTAGTPTAEGFGAFTPIVRAIADESVRFGRPVYLFNGDSHLYNDDKPLAPGSSWLGFYGAQAAPNLTRVTVDGSNSATKDWLKVTIDPASPAVLSWERVPYTGL